METTKIYERPALKFMTKEPSEVYAAQSGTVIFNDYFYANGHQIRIKQDDGYLALYSHLAWKKEDKLVVSVGQKITAGDLIGYTGVSGDAAEIQCRFILIHGEELDYDKALDQTGLKNYFNIS